MGESFKGEGRREISAIRYQRSGGKKKQRRGAEDAEVRREDRRDIRDQEAREEVADRVGGGDGGALGWKYGRSIRVKEYKSAKA